MHEIQFFFTFYLWLDGCKPKDTITFILLPKKPRQFPMKYSSFHTWMEQVEFWIHLQVVPPGNDNTNIRFEFDGSCDDLWFLAGFCHIKTMWSGKW